MEPQERPPVLEYSRLPSPPAPPRSRKPLFARIGWLLICGPPLVVLLNLLFWTMANIFTPGVSYRVGESMSVTATRMDGLGMEWLRVVVATILIALLSAMLWHGLRDAKGLGEK